MKVHLSFNKITFFGCSKLASVIFENASDWYVTTSASATSGRDVDVTDLSVNADNLTGQYVAYYWKR